jgi:hypothetical protein
VGHVQVVTVRAQTAQPIDAASDLVWSLLSTPAAWSLRRGVTFAFEVPWSPPGAGRLFFDVVASRGAFCRVLEVYDEEPGQIIRLRTRHARPDAPGTEVMSLAVRPGKPGVSARIEAEAAVPRESRRRSEAALKDSMHAWLTAMRLVLEGRIPWPAGEMPDHVQKQCAAVPELDDPLAVSAEVLIEAALPVVWESIWSPQTACVVGAEPAAFADVVPGTPREAVGAMQYFIHQGPADRLIGRALVVAELTADRAAVTQTVNPPYDRMNYQLTPAGSSCRLTVTLRWSVPRVQRTPDYADWAAGWVQAVANDFKTLSEAKAASSRQRD